MASIRRLVLLGGITALSLLAVPALASAVVYCVPNNTIDPVNCQTAETTIQNALTAAANTHAVADTVKIGAGSYSEAGLSYNETSTGNTVNVIGAGTGLTLLTIPNTTGNVDGLLVVAPTGSSVSNLAMTIPANADSSSDSGIELGGGAVFGHNLLVNGPAATAARGISLSGQASLDTSTINLPSAGTQNAAVFAETAGSIADSALTADTGVTGSGITMAIDRTTIHASVAGAVFDSGTLNLRDSVIDLGSSNGAVGVQAVNFNNGTTAMTANLNGDTIAGGGSNSTGVQARADSAAGSDPNDTVHDGEDSTVTVANTILSGQTHSLRVEADRGETATMSTSYSNYDSSTKVVTSDLSPGGGTGTASLTEDHQTNLAPDLDGTFHLNSTSPLIDAGSPAGPPLGETDIDGDDRAILGKDGCAARRDIGADEFVPGSPPTLLDCTPPDTSIQSGPTGTITDNTPTFAFASSENPSTFQCSIDGSIAAPCANPFTTPALSDGPHTLAVQAIDGSLNVDPTAATRTFTVDTIPPDTAIGSHPKSKTKSRKATFTFSASEAGSTFLCSFDSKPYATCSGSFTTPKLRRGKHRFDVIATDAVGNRDQSAATFFWKITKRKHR
jgi:hypothetical protein